MCSLVDTGAGGFCLKRLSSCGFSPIWELICRWCAGCANKETRTQGHDAVHLREEGLQRLPDDKIFAKGIAEERVILTFDLDFGEIFSLSKGKKVSVILFRFHNARTTHVIERLAIALNSPSVCIAENITVVIEENRIRIRQLNDDCLSHL